MTVTFRNNGQRVEQEDFGSLDFSDSAAIANYVRARSERKTHLQSLHRQWYINIAMFLGHQYHEWNPHRSSLYLPAQPKHRIRATINRLMPLVRRIVAATLRQRPTWEVNAATAELEDQITAQLSTQFLKSEWKRLNMDEKVIDLLKWRSTTGNVFARVFWDPFSGPRVVADIADFSGRIPSDAKDREKLRKETGKKLLKDKLCSPEDVKSGKVPISLGNPEVEIVSPFRINPHPEATTLYDAPEIIDDCLHPISDVVERFGLDREDIDPGDGKEKEHYERRINRMSSSAGQMRSFMASDDQQSETLVSVRTIYVRPTRDEPTGWWAVVVGDKVVRKARNQPGFPTFPWVMAQEVPVAGRFFGTCVLEQAIPLQVQYNKSRSQIIEHTNTVAQPPWLIPRGSQVDKNKLTGEPGAMIDHTPGIPPVLANVKDLPSTAHHNLAQISSDMEDVTSQHEASRGIAPGRVESGIGVAQLQEQDDGILTPASTILANALGQIGSMILQVTSQKVTEERFIRVVGEDKIPRTNTFYGKDLVGNNSERAGVDYFDVSVEMGANLPQSPAARRQMVMELYQFGVLNPQDKSDRALAFEILELKRDPTTVSAVQADRSNAQRENQALLDGTLPDVFPFDDDEIHIQMHRHFQKSPEYRRMLEKTGGKSSPFHLAFELHIAAHAKVLEAQFSEASQQPAPQLPESGAQPQGLPIPGEETAQ